MEYDLKTPEQQAELANMVRFAIDCSRLTQEHLDYVIAAVAELYKDRVCIAWGHNLPMRHFHAFLEPYPNEEKPAEIMQFRRAYGRSIHYRTSKKSAISTVCGPSARGLSHSISCLNLLKSVF